MVNNIKSNKVPPMSFVNSLRCIQNNPSKTFVTEQEKETTKYVHFRKKVLLTNKKYVYIFVYIRYTFFVYIKVRDRRDL